MVFIVFHKCTIFSLFTKANPTFNPPTGSQDLRQNLTQTPNSFCGNQLSWPCDSAHVSLFNESDLPLEIFLISKLFGAFN